ncbi:MAG: serine hydrolase domain-containing protein [Pseudomonadales bacterium]
MLRKLFIGLLLTLTIVGAMGVWYVRSAAPVASGLIAKQLCTLVFESRLTPRRARALYFRTLIGPAERFFQHEIDPQQPAVSVAGAGAQARAIHRPGLGCTLAYPPDADPGQLVLSPVVTINRGASTAIDHGVRAAAFDQSALEQALDSAFNGESERNTLAIAVMHQGKLVAERYASGITAATPLPGWSMAKSTTATLVGVMQQQGMLRVSDSGLFPQWAAGDHRHNITLEQLLRMTSGIDLPETGSGIDANSIMLFTQNDAAGWAINRGLRAAPGLEFAYTSGSTVLVARYLTEVAGGPQAMYRLIREFFDTLGMHSAILEPDAAGTFIGSSFMVASARDWAKLGQLYLNEGLWNGQQLFAPEWVAFVRELTPQSQARSYGAGFMRRRPLTLYAESQVPALPEDAFAAHGLQNQALYIIPSEDLVVVRLGATSDYWQSGEWSLVADVIAAKR